MIYKMRTRLYVFSILWLVIPSIVLAQKSDSEYPSGKPFATIFTNLHAGVDDGEYNTAFEVTRAYLGYDSQLNEHFYANVTIDIGSFGSQLYNEPQRRYAFFKNAYLAYTSGRVKMNFGIIPIYHFEIQQKTWGHRYLYRSANDEHGLGYNADLGASIQYKLSDAVSADLSITNGEGYNKLQSNNKYKSGAGITGKFDNGIMFRLYGDIYNDEVSEITLSSFIAYNYREKGTIAAEFNQKYNDEFNPDNIRTVLSSYGSWDFNEHWQLFGRYDYVTSSIVGEQLIPYYKAKDGSAIIVGVQYAPIKYVKMAINYQNWVTAVPESVGFHAVYLNVEIKL